MSYFRTQFILSALIGLVFTSCNQNFQEDPLMKVKIEIPGEGGTDTDVDADTLVDVDKVALQLREDAAAGDAGLRGRDRPGGAGR